MRFSEAWLREWVNPPIDTDTLIEQLTMAGLEVDDVEPAVEPFSQVVVGEVLSIEPHPNADRLQVCAVDVGDEELLQIVCGASNVRSGMLAVTALIGAKLPNGMAIKPTKLRGVESQGMLCSATELGLAEKSSGLLELPPASPKGAEVRAVLGLDDVCIEVDLTPNRGDCLSLMGIAREVGVLNRCSVQYPSGQPIQARRDTAVEITVEAPADCPRYLGRVVHGIDPNTETPLWMQERLRRGGIRSLNPVVDVTNYVLLELGQPMHAFDLAKLQGGVVVRRAHDDEELTLLDGQSVSLKNDTLVIADHQRAVAMAGIMGGADTAVNGETRNLLLECAFFSPASIAGRARQYGLHTDSSHRFERGVDPELQQRAMERATALLLQIVGGEPGPVVDRSSPEQLPRRPEVRLREARLRKILGVAVPADEVTDILQRLGMQVTPEVDGWSIQPPSYRFDISMEVDLIEEIARIYGYSRLPESASRGALDIGSKPEGAFELRRAKRLLVARDYQEAITYSFIDPEFQTKLDPGEPPIPLTNPISAELAVMRTSLWPGLLAALRHNRNRQQERVRLFESGLRFLRHGGEILQESMLAGVAAGSVFAEQWGEPKRAVDFYDIKGDAEALLALTGDSGRFCFVPDHHPALHPGQAARVYRNDQAIGWVGMLQPHLEGELDLGGSVALFELLLAGLEQGWVPSFQPLSKFPSIRRDLAVVVQESVSVEQIETCVRQSLGGALTDFWIFDVYRGKGIQKGYKSLALGLILQDYSRTLTDEDGEWMMRSVLQRLRKELGASLRD